MVETLLFQIDKSILLSWVFISI